MKEKKLFNPTGNDTIENRSIIGGNTTNIIQLNNVKYKWARDLYTLMMGNFWIPQKVSMLEDKNDYENLTKEERNAYDSILSFLVFLDSIQTNFVPKISEYVTAPEINLVLTIQAFQEAIHSESYQYVIESILPKEKRDYIYDMWRDNEILFERNKYIAQIYQDFSDNSTKENFFKVLIADYLLEGLYFYNGFNFFYNLSNRNKMNCSADIIRYINRDELCLHPDTEILTPTGWKNIMKITQKDIVAQYNMDTQAISYVKPTHIINRDYDGIMYNMHGNRGKYQICVTKDHDMVIKSKTNNKMKTESVSKIKIQDVKTNGYHYVPVAGKKIGTKNTLTSIERFMVALQADGTIDSQRTGACTGYQVYRFSFSKDRKIIEFENILSDLEKDGVSIISTKTTDIEQSGNKNDMTSFYVKIDNKLKMYKDFRWIDLENISCEWAQDFMSNLVKWDGYTPKEDSKTGYKQNYLYYSTTNSDVADVVQIISAFANYKMKRSIQKDDRSASFSDVHRLYWWTNESYTPTQNMKKEEFPYVGKVGCVTVPDGAIVVRYNNTVSITGNCHVGLYRKMILDLSSENSDIFDKELVYQMFKDAVEQEIIWTNHIIGNSILGVTEKTTEQYTKYLANERLKSLGLEMIFEIDGKIAIHNPYKHLDKIADTSGDGDVKTNFFEATVTSYNQSSSILGWDSLRTNLKNL